MTRYVPQSPITHSSDVTLVRTVATQTLIEKYRDEYKVDVSANFSGVEELQVWRCNETGYAFFTPFSTMGDAQFYEELYAHDVDGFYMDDKWEHLLAAKWIKTGESVLDIGCGGGAFLAMLKAKTPNLYGLEQSKVGRQEAREKGIVVSSEMIQAHHKNTDMQYDVVTSFQVLEHVAEIKSFLDAKIGLVKPGGLMVISVPNNAAFLKLDPEMTLNCPPHHVGLWDKQSLESIARLYGLAIEHIETEPLQKKNMGWFKALLEGRHIKPGLSRWLYYKLGFSNMLGKMIDEISDTIDGHTIIAAYRKPS